MSKTKRILKITTLVLSILSLSFSVIPMLFGNFHVGYVALCIYGALLLALLIIKSGGLLSRILTVLTATITLVGAVFLSFMLHAAHLNRYTEDAPATVIVMGCMVRNGNPSLMLAARLNEAYEVLNQNPDYPCIVSGGLTYGEPMSEGEVMKNYLVELGIEPSRIYIEENSTATEENIEFSTEIIEENDLPKSLIIASDGYHQLRSRLFAEKYGYDAYSANSLSATGLVPGFYIREMLAILHMTFL